MNLLLNVIYSLMIISAVRSYEFVPNISFDIRYINLARKPERFVYMEKLLKTAKCNYKRFDAVDGVALLNGTKNLSDFCEGYDIPIREEGLADKLKHVPGTVGCQLSHKILNSIIAKSNSNKPVLIFEDDIKVERDFVERFEDSLKGFDEDWDMILLSSWRSIDEQRQMNFDAKIQRVSWFYETYAYAVNGARAARKISNLLDSCVYGEPVDVFFANLVGKGVLNVFATVPPLCSQQAGHIFPTDIETSNNNKIYFPIYNPLDEYIDRLERAQKRKEENIKFCQ